MLTDGSSSWQSFWWTHLLDDQKLGPCPSKVPLPVTCKPSIFSKATQVRSVYAFLFVSAFRVPWISKIIGFLHGPPKTTGDISNVPGGIRTFAGATDWHACTQTLVSAYIYTHAHIIYSSLQVNSRKYFNFVGYEIQFRFCSCKTRNK